jgi:ABC-type multidrug transport system ATPase subunit
VCRTLRAIADLGLTVVAVIHPPRLEIFNSFDSLILLNKGRVMYNGPVPAVAEYFEARGHPLPKAYNPADWIMNVAQSVPFDELKEKKFFLEDERKIPDAFTGNVEGKDEIGITLTERHTHAEFDDRPVGFDTEVSLLFNRELKNLTRDTAAVGARFGLTIFLSVLIGVIFLDVGSTDPAEPQVR